MRFLHIFIRHFGVFSTRIPVYLVLRYLRKRGHQNIILNNDYTTEDEEREYIFIRNIGRSYAERFVVVARALASIDYDVVIAYDTLDAMLSFHALLFKMLLPILRRRKRRLKFIYYNLELFSLDYPSAVKRIVGRGLEQLFVFGCDAFVSLSQMRLKIAERIFKIPCRKFVIPNSFDFEAREVRRKPHRPVRLLYAGGVERHLLEELRKVENGPEITVHGASKYGIGDVGIGGNIILNTEVIRSYEKFADFVSRHDGGIVWYSLARLNDRFAGLSSGKYFRYLSLARPVIVRNMPELSETTIQNNFGVVIDDFSEIKEAAEMLSDRYGEFVDGILQNYHKFEFSRNFEKLYEFIIG